MGIYLSVLGLEEAAVDLYKKEQMKNNLQKDEISSRIKVICSDLRDFRADFIQCINAFGLCRVKNIDKFKPKDKDLPDNNIEYRLRIFFGPNQHKFHLWNDKKTYDWTINNTGFSDYTDMLGDIWPEAVYNWLVEKPAQVEFLNKKAESICELSEPLLKIKKYRGVTAKVRKIVRCNGSQWTDRTSVDWSYPDEIEDIAKELENAVTQKPPETEQKARSPLKKIIGWIFKKTSPLICAIIVTVIATIIATIIVGIFTDFGWIERIKTFIYRIFTTK